MESDLIKCISDKFGMKLIYSEIGVKTFFTFKGKLQLLENERKEQFVLKEVPPAYFELTSAEGFFHALSLFTKYVQEGNFPIVEYLLTNESKIFVNFNGKIFVLMKFEEGELYSNNIKEVKNIATLHGKLNSYLENIDEETKQQIQDFCKNPFLRQDLSLTDLYELVVTGLFSVKESESSKLILEILPLVKENLDIIPDKIYANLPKQVAYKDIFPGNVLFIGSDKKPFLLDPDEMTYLPRIRDVAYGIWGFSTRRPPQQGVFAPDLDKANEYLKSYLHTGALTTEEVDLIPKAFVRIWVEDVLHYSLLSPFTNEDKHNVIRKVKHLKNAIEVKNVRFE